MGGGIIKIDNNIIVVTFAGQFQMWKRTRVVSNTMTTDYQHTQARGRGERERERERERELTSLGRWMGWRDREETSNQVEWWRPSFQTPSWVYWPARGGHSRTQAEGQEGTCPFWRNHSPLLRHPCWTCSLVWTLWPLQMNHKIYWIQKITSLLHTLEHLAMNTIQQEKIMRDPIFMGGQSTKFSLFRCKNATMHHEHDHLYFAD